ncbi:metallophosphoesterase family protein [Mangrovibrevibacter kandeliae]|uniref:metallophosphoesterase family protein n=1 Tax=Mangrovibrevibacter kandeliae TaxID=2968473 RepID=UPI0021184D24|nr:metallophosphoesterase family protein [Aurantimonas sp. CSK15Z-1]MCQ8783404.1 metallophosphoesterase family protein [Aurantimonas sp. CSK15Z-1]
MALFFTSDTHFADPRVLKIDRRPFPSLAAHDEALIERWNAVVGPADTIWHLGDFARAGRPNVEALLARLNGEKHLIVGNNDPETTVTAQGWASTQHYAEMEMDGTLFVICHYPFRTWNKIGKKSVDLHGHSHGKLTPIPRQYDLGVDAWDYRPVTLAEVLAKRRRGSARTTTTAADDAAAAGD